MIRENVILLHGLSRTFRSMGFMQRALEEYNYHVINVDYPSRHQRIEDLSERVIPAALLRCLPDLPVSFVSHSMGGILVRHYLATSAVAHLKRVVMLGPPNNGSELVDYLSSVPGFGVINGEAGKQLGASGNQFLTSLGPVDFDLGVIAGTNSLNPLYSAMLPGRDDGKVTVESTRVDGMRDHIALPVTHTFMMRKKQVVEQVLHYLEHGQFSRGAG